MARGSVRAAAIGSQVLKRLDTWLFSDVDGALFVLRRLLSENARAYAGRYALAFVMMAVVAACTAASAWIMKDMINQVFLERDGRMVWVIAGFVLAIFWELCKPIKQHSALTHICHKLTQSLISWAKSLKGVPYNR